MMTTSAGSRRRVRAMPAHDGASLEQVFGPIRRELSAVRRRVLSQLTDPIARMVVYIITAGGKQVRPALVLLSGAVGRSPQRAALRDVATAVELIHTATLIHDDIIDQAPLRRSQPTFHHRWGTERAVLMGDYLYATAFTVLGRLRIPYVTQVMADVCQELSRGELLEVEARFRLDLGEDEYLEIIRNKTASLFAGCCRSGAYLGGLRAGTIDRFATFGLNFGMAFQIMDDCLDFMGRARQLGKSVQTDLDKGTVSLPIIYLTRRLSLRERRRLFAPLRAARPGRSGDADGDAASDPAFLKRVAHAARESGALTDAQARAERFMQRAQAAIANVSANGLGPTYRRLAAYAISRRS